MLNGEMIIPRKFQTERIWSRFEISRWVIVMTWTQLDVNIRFSESIMTKTNAILYIYNIVSKIINSQDLFEISYPETCYFWAVINSEKKICPFLENWKLFSRNEHFFFLRSAKYFREKDRFFLTILMHCVYVEGYDLLALKVPLTLFRSIGRFSMSSYILT